MTFTIGKLAKTLQTLFTTEADTAAKPGRLPPFGLARQRPQEVAGQDRWTLLIVSRRGHGLVLGWPSCDHAFPYIIDLETRF